MAKRKLTWGAISNSANDASIYISFNQPLTVMEKTAIEAVIINALDELGIKMTRSSRNNVQ